MYRQNIAIFAVVAAACVLGANAVNVAQHSAKAEVAPIDVRGFQVVPATRSQVPNVGLDFCPTCISFVQQSIQDLIQIIANGGILGGCQALCTMLPNKIAAEVCNVICDIAGIEGFIKVLGMVDLDPFYACELFAVCHTTDDGSAKFSNINVQPNPGHTGQTLDVSADLTVFNATGCGEMVFAIQDPEGNVLGNAQTFGSLQPNKYSINLQIDTTPSQQQGGEEWPAGKYEMEFAVCQGECGSHHPHSETYDVKTTTFSLEE